MCASRLFLGLLLGLLMVGVGMGCERTPTPVPDGRRVIFVLMDAARADHFSYQGYAKPTSPEIDAIAAQGAAFLQTYAQGATTRMSLPRIMTSRYFTQCIINTFDLFPIRREEYTYIQPDPTRVILPQVFRDAGWTTVAFNGHVGITASSEFGRSFDDFVPIAADEGSYPRGGKVLSAAAQWIRRHRDTDAFVYIHVMDTHFPHYVTEDTTPFLPPKPYPVERFQDDGNPHRIKSTLNKSTTQLPSSFSERDRQYLDALYDGDVRSISRDIGAFWDTLEQAGLTRSTVLVLTADHGDELGEHGYVSHFGGYGWDTIHHIPLLVVAPGRIPAGQRISTPVESIDILPTMLDMAEIPLPAGKTVDGRSLAGLWSAPPPPPQPIFYSDSAGWGIRTAEWLYYELLDGGAPRLYNLTRDPGQLRNVVETHPDVAAQLQRQLVAALGPARERYTNQGWRAPVLPFAIPLKRKVLGRSDDVIRPDVADLRGMVDEMLTDNKWTLEPPRTLWAMGATETPPPLTLTFTVPPATYRIALGMKNGAVTLGSTPRKFPVTSVRVKVEDETAWRVITSRSPHALKLFKQPPWWAFWRRGSKRHGEFQVYESYIEVGTYQVTTEAFRMSVATAPETGAFLHEVLFIPAGVGEDEVLGRTDRERLDMLRALGYVE